MQVNYWASFAQRQGMELNLGKGSFKSKYSLTLEPIEDGLIHRPRVSDDKDLIHRPRVRVDKDLR